MRIVDWGEKKKGRGKGDKGGKQHTEFISLPKPNFFRQEVETLIRAGILSIGPGATLHGCSTDAFRNRLRQDADSRFQALGSEYFARSADQVVDNPLPVLEGGVVLGDFAFAVVGVPGVDVDGKNEVQGGEVELESGCPQLHQLAARKMGN